MAFDLSQYETVDERLHKWWKDYPDGRIETELLEASANRFIVIARIFKTEVDLKACASGIALETISDRGVNANFALPNAETSAIGRALANAGFSAKGKRPSREEMASVNEKENKVIYGRPGSRSAAVESALRQAFSSDEGKATDPTPVSWSVGDVVDVVNSGEPNPPPECEHGHILKSGLTKATNKPYYGYVCKEGVKEHARWAKVTAAGGWYFPEDKE
jgi:hypothetical protein